MARAVVICKYQFNQVSLQVNPMDSGTVVESRGGRLLETTVTKPYLLRTEFTVSVRNGETESHTALTHEHPHLAQQLSLFAPAHLLLIEKPTAK